jgi:DNA-binding transcriptional LysR family regulator
VSKTRGGPWPVTGTAADTTAVADIGIRHLRSFLALAEHLSFTQAAVSLRTSQPSLTRCIHRLEESLGVRLFHRTTRSVRLSEAGLRLREELRVLVPRLESALSLPADISTLRMGFAWLFPDELLDGAVIRFEKTFGVTVELVRRDVRNAGLDDGDVQLAVLRGRRPARGLRSVLLAEERQVAAVARTSPLARRRALAWTDLGHHPVVLNTVSGATHPGDWPPDARPARIRPCGGFTEWLELIAAGHGVGVAPELALHQRPHPGVQFVPLTGAPTLPLWLACPSAGAHPLASRFLDRMSRSATRSAA